jgi:hypothetical protein
LPDDHLNMQSLIDVSRPRYTVISRNVEITMATKRSSSPLDSGGSSTPRSNVSTPVKKPKPVSSDGKPKRVRQPPRSKHPSSPSISLHPSLYPSQLQPSLAHRSELARSGATRVDCLRRPRPRRADRVDAQEPHLGDRQGGWEAGVQGLRWGEEACGESGAWIGLAGEDIAGRR